MVHNDGGPAFPYYDSVKGHTQEGMTLRDWFAGNIDVSGYSFSDMDEAAKIFGIDPPFDESTREVVLFSIRLTAAIRYAMADAMLEARKKC